MPAPPIRFPKPLQPGDRIAITAPSSGASGAGAKRIAFAADHLRGQGYEVVLGECLDGSGHVSAPRAERAAELVEMLCDPAIRAVVPPWGGETAIDLLTELDWGRLAVAEPTWLLGYSDLSTLLVPITLRLGWATMHGDNLADTPYEQPPGLVSWRALMAATGSVTQHDSRVVKNWVRSQDDPRATRYLHVGEGTWTLHGRASLVAEGRLVGGCIETLANIAGTPFGDVAAFGAEHGPLLVYLEAAGDDAFTICRNLHGLRLAGWFDHAAALLVGRTNAPDAATLTQREAVLDAVAGLDLPVVFDLEIGHVPPHLPLVNGARARVVVNDGEHSITQRLNEVRP